jgi:hypothetical protein
MKETISASVKFLFVRVRELFSASSSNNSMGKTGRVSTRFFFVFGEARAEEEGYY